MPPTTTHTADITDPLSGDTVTLAAASEAELEQLIDSYLHRLYPPAPDPEDT